MNPETTTLTMSSKMYNITRTITSNRLLLLLLLFSLTVRVEALWCRLGLLLCSSHCPMFSMEKGVTYSLRCQGCVGGCPDVLVSRTSIASSQSFLRDDSRCQMVWLQPA